MVTSSKTLRRGRIVAFAVLKPALSSLWRDNVLTWRAQRQSLDRSEYSRDQRSWEAWALPLPRFASRRLGLVFAGDRVDAEWSDLVDSSAWAESLTEAPSNVRQLG